MSLTFYFPIILKNKIERVLKNRPAECGDSNSEELMLVCNIHSLSRTSLTQSQQDNVTQLP